jgi:hypothetical protein
MKNRLLVLLMGALMMALSAAPALAQGQVEMGPAHANSICSFSGLNDEFTTEGGSEHGRVQSYGQYVRYGEKAEQPSPSVLCNGHTHPYPEAFPPPAP